MTGPQLEPAKKALLQWWETNRRTFPWRETQDEYLITVSELLLKQTRADRVAGFLQAFLGKYPGWQNLASADQSTLERDLSPLGLQRQRATLILRLAKSVRSMNYQLPGTREGLEELPSIGQYVASAILLLGRDRCEPLLDTNMSRFLKRFLSYKGKSDLRIDRGLQQLARLFVTGSECKETNFAVLDLAAAICHPQNPRCEVCPVQSWCNYGRGV